MSIKNKFKLKSTRKRRTRNGHSSQLRRKNGSAYTIRRGGFLTPLKQRYTAFRQRRAVAATARARESQARIAIGESPRFRTSPGRWIRTRFRRNPSAINTNPINPSIYEHDTIDPIVTNHYIQIFSDESTASPIEKTKAMEDMNKYIAAVKHNSDMKLETTMGQAHTAIDEANVGHYALSRALSTGAPEVNQADLDALEDAMNESSPQPSHRSSRSSRSRPPPPPPPFFPTGQFVRRRPGSNKKK